MKRFIYLQKIGQIDQSILILLRKNLKWTLKQFNVAVDILNDEIPLTKAEYNALERKYDADLVMQKLYKFSDKIKFFRILGVMDYDIFARQYNFLFGSAKNPDKKRFRLSPFAIISVTRLREEFWGKLENNALFELRILKEAIHELGHTFGLFHCDNYCIMRFSEWIGNTDDKPPKFCENCLNKLRSFFKNLN